MNLASLLKEEKRQFANHFSSDLVDSLQAAVDELKASSQFDRALRTGATLPAGTLINQDNHRVELHTLLQQGPLIIKFYRGGWCPYCNLELKAYLDLLPEIKGLGGNVVAITPELPDSTEKTIDKNGLTFDVLTDRGGEYAKQLGIVFTLPEILRPVYDYFNLDLEQYNGTGGFELPLPAVYVVDTNGKVIYDFVEIDYTKRADPHDVINALKTLC